MSRLVVVSNRVAPITEGEPTAGGLAAGVLDALKQKGGIWFGWSGEITDDAVAAAHVERTVGSDHALHGRSVAAATTTSSIAALPMARCGRRCTTRSAMRISTGRSSPAIAGSMRCSRRRWRGWCGRTI